MQVFNVHRFRMSICGTGGKKYEQRNLSVILCALTNCFVSAHCLNNYHVNLATNGDTNGNNTHTHTNGIHALS